MSEQNKALTRRFYEDAFNKKNLNVIDELCAPDFVDHSAMPGQAPGAKGLKDTFISWMQAFPDLHVTVEEIMAERDIVATRFTMEATHRGEFMGAAPTGKRVTFHGIDMVRIKDGKATEAWHQGDDAIVLMQLGAKMPA